MITKDFHRAMLSVQEEEPPPEEELLEMKDAPKVEADPEEPGPVWLCLDCREALSSSVPELNEAEVMARTQRAFEIQRFLRAGVPLQEAETRYAAGEVLPPSEESRRPEPLPAAGRPPPSLLRSRLGAAPWCSRAEALGGGREVEESGGSEALE